MNQSIDYRMSLNETNIVKSIAICAMLWHHLFFQNHEYGSAVFKFALIGKVCVAIFVFLSGYGMAIKMQKINPKASIKIKFIELVKILAQRYIKFYLNYWIIFAITVPLGVIIFSRQLSDAYGEDSCIWSNLIVDLIGFKSFNSYNTTWWFNALILTLWLFTPWLYWSMKSKIVSVPMLIFLFLDPNRILNPLNILAPELPSYTFIYALGIFAVIHIEKINLLLNRINPYIVTAFMISISVSLLYMRNIYVIPHFWGKNVDPFASLFISMAVVCTCRLTRYNLKPMIFVGKHSMNIYLIHTFNFAYFFSNFIYEFKHPILIFMVLFLISLGLSIIIEFAKKKTGFYIIQSKINILLKTNTH